MAQNSHSETPAESVSREDEVEALQRLDGDELAVVNDDHPEPGYLDLLVEGDRMYVVCVTDHRNGVADGEIIPNGLFRRYIGDGLNWIDRDDAPDKVITEVNRLAAE